MTKKKKIVIAVLVIIAALAVVLGCMIKAGYFSASNYTHLNYDRYITVGKYKGLTYTKEKATVTQKEIDAQIKSNVQAKATTKTVKTGTVKKGDTVSIDFVGKVGGKTFSGGSASDYTLKIGSGSMIDGFEDGLIGEKVGSKVKLHLTFPKDYNTKKLRGKKVVFTVTINSKKVTSTPKYNTDFVKKYTNYKTKKAYEDSIKKQLLESKEQQNESTVQSTLWQEILSSSKVKKYPKRQLKYEKQKLDDNYTKAAKQYNMTKKKLLKAQGMTEKDITTQAKSTVKAKLVIYSIAKKENIKLTDKQYNNALKKMLKNAGFTEKSFKKQYNQTIQEYAEDNGFRESMLLTKVLKRVEKLGKAQTASSSKSSSSKSSK
ncbi:MAG: trigger factor [Clostridiales bacterium]|jgi:trigger factor|nr:trigger factor [Clostridiales bacterium]